MISAVTCIVLGSVLGLPTKRDDVFELSVLHFNDFHARYLDVVVVVVTESCFNFSLLAEMA